MSWLRVLCSTVEAGGPRQDIHAGQVRLLCSEWSNRGHRLLIRRIPNMMEAASKHFVLDSGIPRHAASQGTRQPPGVRCRWTQFMCHFLEDLKQWIVLPTPHDRAPPNTATLLSRHAPRSRPPRMSGCVPHAELHGQGMWIRDPTNGWSGHGIALPPATVEFWFTKSVPKTTAVSYQHLVAHLNFLNHLTST